MSLRQVAAASGLSVSFLSTLERGDTDIALERLARLANVFGHDIGSFLGFSRQEAMPSVYRAEQQKTLERAPGVRYLVLNVPQAGYQVVQGEFEPGASLAEEIQHEGTEMIVVTAGSLTVRYNGRDYVLHEGDCGSWSAGYTHSFRNDGTEPARMTAFLSSRLY
ncbi:hypothetical protein GCM10009738_80600 [Kitasatospora viridis]